MTAIHHATAKRAEKLGITLELAEDDSVIAVLNGKVLATGDSAKDVLKDAEAKLANGGDAEDADDEAPEGAEEDGDEGEGDEPQFKGSIVKPKYRKQYAPKNDTCGDDIALTLADYLAGEDDGGDKCLDLPKLVRFAKANDCWVDKYAKLNPGQVRMNVGNRLRAKVRKGYEPKWVK